MKIRIVLPSPFHGSASPQTRKSIKTLMGSGIADMELIEVKSAFVSKARNFGISNGCELIHQEVTDVDYILHVDADMAFTPEAIRKLIDADKDIISAAYQRRDYPDQMVAGAWDEKGASFLHWKTMGLQKVDFTGCGLQLVKVNVFSKLTYPWYFFKCLEIECDDGKTRAYEAGEDIGFASKCKEAGIDVYVDCDNRVEHLTDWNGVSMENPKETGVDSKAFEMYQAGAVDAVKASIDRIVKSYTQNINQLVAENIELKKKIEDHAIN